ncbi:hypothetical protein B296_00027563 [Ensete ventricosum]|uniref:Uncharacterized protein n=1 Tax=Ensete ventricosum TaxID=4639 RepID=A0A426Y5K9_ENSVE|nr:hypothetical protein B296_00027563 [Ensete ventricosum]
MTVYIAREASKLWRKVCVETSVELQLLAEKWKLLFAGLMFQSVSIYYISMRYTVNLVVFFIDKKLPGCKTSLVVSKQRQRMQVNGTHGDDGNHVHSESAVNGVNR